MNIDWAISRSVCCVFASTGLWLAPLPHAHAATPNVLAPLNYLVGDWNCAGHFSNGKPIQSHDSVSTELGGHWLRVQHAENPPSRWHADEWWGYDKTSRHFTVTLFDNFDDVRHYVSSGWSGYKLVLDNTATKGFIDHFVFERRGDAAYRVVYSYRNGNGAWRVGDEQVCTRERQQPRP